MTNILPRSTNSLLSLVAIATLTTSAACASAAPHEQNEPQAGTAMQASQAQTQKPAAEKTELSMGQVIAKLKEQEYADITEIEREDGRYCVDARDADGKKVELYVDAKTGEITKEDEEDEGDGVDKADLSKDEVIAKLKEQGYPEVSKIGREREGDQYWVMVSDADGNKFELHVNAKTGEITRKEKRGYRRPEQRGVSK